MTTHSPLRGRRIHISGSIDSNPEVATTESANRARSLVKNLVVGLMERGATFVVPVDKEPIRDVDERPICFDWLIWNTLAENLGVRPVDAPDPLAIAIEHHKTEAQIPAEHVEMWNRFRRSDLVQIENVSHWNMNSKRMEAQARHGEILITVGGGEGVLFLANLYHDAGMPVIPLNTPIVAPGIGSRKIFESIGMSATRASSLFRASRGAHTWINRINYQQDTNVVDQVSDVLKLLEDLDPPRAFIVRLLNKEHPSFQAVDNFFETVVKPILEGELGFKMVAIDGRQPYEQSRMDQEIFSSLHRSSLVIADLTGDRPNCFLELGYAFGRGLKTMVTAQKGTSHPFDLTTLGALHWDPSQPLNEQRNEFRKHWTAIQSRPPLVPAEPLIP